MTAPDLLCLDVGSTYTKAVLLDADGVVRGTAETPTTRGTDVLDGCRLLAERLGAGHDATRLACSSAGGGLRLAVVGYERQVTAEAGHRVGLSAGARVVHVSSRARCRARTSPLAAQQLPPGPRAARRRHRRWQRRSVAAQRNPASQGAACRLRSWWPETSRHAIRSPRSSGSTGPAGSRWPTTCSRPSGSSHPSPPAPRHPGGLPRPRHRRQGPVPRGPEFAQMVQAPTPDAVLRRRAGPSRSTSMATSSSSTSALRPPTSTPPLRPQGQDAGVWPRM